jgi:nucleotide-binding universal stress UspA family protein
MSTAIQIRDQKQSVTFRQILIATDFSDASRRALDHAIAIARRFSSTLSVVCAIAPESRNRIPLERLPHELNRPLLEAEQEMKSLGDDPRMKDIKHRLILEPGQVWEVLASVMEREDVDLLVLGTHGRGGLKKIALGSVAEQVLRLAKCPVLTVGPHAHPAGSGALEFRRILFATDFGPASAKAFPFALSLAEDYLAKLVLLHMVMPMPLPDSGPAAYGPSSYATEECSNWQRSMREESARKLKQLIPLSAKLAAEPEYITGMDFLPEGILSTAAAHKIDLIVMGANHTASPRLTAHLPWAVTHEVIRQAQCPVLTVAD